MNDLDITSQLDMATTVPLSWVFYLAGILIFMFVWWLRIEFKKNDAQHQQTDKKITGVHKRIDHLILHLLGKPYEDPEEDNP